MLSKILAYSDVGFYEKILKGNLLIWILIFPLQVYGGALSGPCPFAGLDTEFTCSSENTVDLVIDFNVPASIDDDNIFYVVFEEDTVGSYSYDDLPLELYDLPIVQGEGASLFLLDDNDSDCDILIGIPDSEINCQCSISDVKAEILYCETEDMAVYRINSFEFFDVANSGFSILINNQVYPSYFYDSLPLEVLGPMDSSGLNEVVVYDIGTDDCLGTTTVESIECAFCSLSNLQVAENDCEDDLFSLTLDFDFENVSQEGFLVSVNGTEQGTFEYEALPLVNFGSFTGESGQLVIEVLDGLNPGCQASTTIDVEPCETCQLSNLTVNQNPCIGESYSLQIDFDFENVGDEGFDVTVNSIPQGVYDYSELPLDFGEFGIQGVNMIEISDVESSDCLLSEEFISVACAEPICDIGNIILLDQECAEDFRYYQFDLDYNNSVSDSFDVFVHQLPIPFDRFAYTDLPVVVNDQGIFVTSTDDFEIAVVDKEDSDCAKSIPILNPLGCIPDCVIGNIEIGVSDDCLEDGTFSIVLSSDFEFDDSGSFFFSVNGGESTTFSYSELPKSISGFVGDGDTAYLVELVQLNNNACSEQQLLNPVLCPAFECNILSFSLEAGDCQEDGTYSLTANAQIENPGESGFTLLLNGTEFGPINTFPINLGTNYVGNGQTLFNASLTAIDDSNCQATASLDPVTCAGAICSFSNFSAIPSASDECNDGLFSVTINFLPEGEGLNGFRVFVNGVFAGQFPYDILPLVLPQGFSGDGITSYEIVVVDSDDSECTETELISPFLCETPQCLMSNLSVTPLPCEESGLYDVEVNFDIENGSAAGFKIFFDGSTYESYVYSELENGPIVISDIDGNGGAEHVLTISDTDNPDCSLGPVLINQDCTQECFLPPLLGITFGNCDEDEQIQLILSFNEDVLIPVANDSFNLLINNQLISTNSYDDLEAGLDLGEFPGDGVTSYLIEIQDQLNEDCTSFVNTTALEDCTAEEPCIISDFEFETICVADSFNIEINLVVSGQSETGFQVEVDDNVVGLFDVNLPILIGPYPADGSTNYSVNFFDVEDPACGDSFDVGTVDCSSTECTITNLEVQNEDCQANGTFNALIDFTVQNAPSDSFVVTYGANSEQFAYSDPAPYVIFFVPGNDTEWVFTITDSQATECNNTVILPPVNCQVCAIENLTAQGNCEPDGTLTIELDFDFENVGDSGFTVLMEDEPFQEPATATTDGILFYDVDVPYQITGLDGTGDTDFTFTVLDNDFFEDCTATIVYSHKEACVEEIDNCVVDITDVILGECVADSILLEVLYEFDNVSTDSFAVIVGSLFERRFQFGDQVFLGPYLGDGSVYEITLTDLSDSDDCQFSFTVETEALFCAGLIPEGFNVGDPYPNPVLEEEFLLADVGIEVATILTIEVFNTAGQKLGTSNTHLEAGEHTIKIDLDGYLAGLYLVRASFSESDFVFVSKIIKGKSEY